MGSNTKCSQETCEEEGWKGGLRDPAQGVEPKANGLIKGSRRKMTPLPVTFKVYIS